MALLVLRFYDSHIPFHPISDGQKRPRVQQHQHHWGLVRDAEYQSTPPPMESESLYQQDPEVISVNTEV